MPLLRHTTRKHEQNSGGPTASVYLGAKARVAVARVAVARVPRLLALGLARRHQSTYAESLLGVYTRIYMHERPHPAGPMDPSID